jgi:glycosyltransferase involved in cell wall biosynthesis
MAVLPARNEAPHLRQLVSELRSRVDTIVVVDDASEDSTAAMAAFLGCETLVNENRRGYGATLRRGLIWAYEQGGSTVISVDADGQHEASWIDESVPLLENGADVVFANRFVSSSGVPETKLLSNTFAWHCVKKIVGRSPVCHDVSCGFRVYGRRGLRETIDAPFDERMGYSFTHATCVHIHQAALEVAAFRARAIYPPDARTSVGELHDFLGWLSETGPFQQDGQRWLRELESNHRLLMDCECWCAEETLHITAEVSQGWVHFSANPPRKCRT